MAVERTFFMVKPDGVKRYLSNLILTKLVESGFKILVRRRATVSPEQAQQLYLVHKGKPFYEGLVKFITSGPSIQTVLEGENAVAVVRSLMGPTDPRQAPLGTIRGDNMGEPLFTEDGTIMNLCHGSDSLESAKKEIAIFFNEKDLK
ncbi:MAG: nucleoside-diphosphate kinase [bacterium]